MDLKEKKICWSCNAEVHIYTAQCPSCGSDLTECNKGKEPQQFQSPYQFVSPTHSEEEAVTPPNQFAHYAHEDNTEVEPQENPIEEDPVFHPQFIKGVKPLLLILPGGIFCAFACMLIFFSNPNGELILKWKSALWPFYLLVAFPMLYFGWKALRQIEER